MPSEPATCAFVEEERLTRGFGRWSFRVIAGCFRLARGFFEGFLGLVLRKNALFEALSKLQLQDFLSRTALSPSGLD